ncbi:anthranilate synthase component II [Alkaliflexus imshenetskii]|uniref:anthranilate synthase component II n=1 Tax=Alkaliflexus imshenetskii TaxID=286730 RepID=UPI000478D3B3|nr:aminodeoxychorismate/anthranilate synthase component II [Alkaliflexus imshenetskii]
MKILVLDNYDSFTYNLVHYLEELAGHEVDVFRNDQITVEQAAAYDKIVLSPGPGIPDEAGILKPLIHHLGPTHSILGVCLGCQAIAEVFGGSILNLSKVYHGVATPVKVIDNSELLFKSLPTEFLAGRYHSWVVNDADLPDTLQVTVRDSQGQIMGLRHKEYDVRGVQFHPESILTEFGKEMISNWLNS